MNFHPLHRQSGQRGGRGGGELRERRQRGVLFIRHKLGQFHGFCLGPLVALFLPPRVCLLG